MRAVTSGTVVWLMLWMCVRGNVYQKVETTLPLDGAGSLKHMLLYNDELYVGATNRIFRVNFNLSVLVSKDTGPVNDNFMCDLPPDSECEFTKIPRDNVNKILLINENRDGISLITCGSVYQGACETRYYHNLDIKKEYHGMDASPPSVHALAADSPEGSTVAFIAPGFSNTSVMYVATTYTGGKDRPFRESVPAISTRKIYPPSEIFNLYFEDPSPIRDDASKIYIQKSIRSQFIVEYIAGFTSETYSYFLTTQPQSENKLSGNIKRISKIIHICQNDKLLESYVDIPLVCKDGSKEYNLVTSGTVIQPGAFLQKSMRLRPQAEKVLVATFTDESGNNSAVCIFSMNNIRSKVVENAKLCRKGNTSVNGMKYIQYGSDCQARIAEESPEQLLCHTQVKTYARIAGIVGVTTQPAIAYNNVTLTSVALSRASKDYTVAFIGDSKGQIRKLVLKSATSATEYDTHFSHDLTVTGNSPINKDLFLDSSLQYLFAMTEKNVARLRVENCEQYTTCTGCLSSKDPYCGWCTLENRCTVQSNCIKPDVDRWLNGLTSNCIEIMNTSPSFVSASEVTKIHLTITRLPRGTNYSCVFKLDSGEWSTQADHWSFGLNCRNTPNVTSLGMDFGPKGHRNITIAIRSLETGKLFVTKEITFYNCASFTSCSQCTDNSYSCDWCIYDNRCTYDPRSCDPRRLVVSRNRHSGDGNRGPLYCPQMNRLETEPIFIPNRISKAIDIKGHNFPVLQQGVDTHYQAIILGRTWEVTASCDRVTSERLQCTFPSRNYPLSNGMLNADIKVLFNGDIEIEHDGVQVSIYSCRDLANEDCSYCKHMQQHRMALGCAWCGGQCEYRHNSFCAGSASNAACPAPEITSINPVNGHYMGGTRVTIQGKNLGSEFSEIQHEVNVAGVPCTPLYELYVPSRRIVCVTGTSDEFNKSGPVIILRQRFPHNKFHYLTPYINKVSPVFGPKSGGSQITINGLYLNCGNRISITINNKTCAILRKRTLHYVECETPGNLEPGEGMVTARVDGQIIRSFLPFIYIEDPTIHSIHPSRSFSSGGRSLTVTGTNFTCIKKPKMFAIVDSVKTAPTSCIVTNSTRMTCPTPQILLSNLNRLKRSTSQLVAEIGFIMDNVMAVQNLSAYFPNVAHTLEYFPDPEMFNFTEKDQIKELKGEVLIVRGKGLNVAADKDDIKVYVGQKVCNITNVQADQIYCSPPSSQPETSDKHRNAPPVVVQIGNRHYLIGYLKYETHIVPSGKSVLMYVIIGVSALAFFIMVAGVFFCCFYRRQKNQSKREFKKMQIQLDNLESNVRNECRQAFAELQTDMTDLTNDLDASKKPFYSFESYTFNVLFPGMVDHVILRPPLRNGNSIDKHPDVGIVHFSQLLQNKHFLLLLVRTLERQKSFSIRDKSNVASLLMILYQNNMEYATEILKTLLNDLVEKSVESKHPKLMLRRTESVVEKLLANWLSLCLYKYLVDEAHFSDSAGSSLYILYKAIKVQVEKGPIDHMTNDARYSLSEDRLLRTEFKLEPETLSLNVEYEGKKYKCRVLDCDTISQAKEKMLDTIFRNFPYSQRPPAVELDLELTSSGRMLMDEDNSSSKTDGWKQLNTLKHYRVCDGAELVLTQHQKCQTLPRSPNVAGCSVAGSIHSAGFTMREGVPITRTDSEFGTKIWHLVKQHDDSNNMTGGLKLSSEIYLTRLLSTKGTLKQYIDDFFETILTVDSSLPPVIKYLFDMMDDAARKYGIGDPDVVHTWKCNSLLLRFWVNIIKNPNFVYDIHKPSIVDSCLSVVAQTFMDSCSTSEHRLGKDSPSNKLLFAKDIPKYRRWVEKYFSDIQQLPAVSDQDLNAYLAEVSRMSTGHFTKENALYELYNYVQKYNNEINDSLETDGFANAQQLPAKLGHVITSMEGPSVHHVDYV